MEEIPFAESVLMVRLERKKKKCQSWNHKVTSSVFLWVNHLAQRHKMRNNCIKAKYTQKKKKKGGVMTLNQVHWGKTDGTKIAHVIGNKTCKNLKIEWKVGFLSEK